MQRVEMVDGAMAVDRALALATRPPLNGAYPTLAIDGRGASGKTLLAGRIARAVPGLVVVHGDDYFESTEDAVMWGEFNEERFDREVLAALRTGGRTFAHRPFDFLADTVVDHPPHRVAAGVLVERCYAFALDVPWDVRVWVETPRDECLRRGIHRDAPAVGERALIAWRDVWQPREDEYIAGTHPEERADVIVVGSVTPAS